ncbi:molybdopterin molybdotransferase MoeA [Mobiluncus curtisii]|jgi:hypothetical protein|uniref:molybdopterin molybdotransferase MoeA n=1 Tax=Mobiluncus curtisii TaxID=2051 RepID=UPI0014706D25|nr:gephyrin-like molybdotransferase Glp [Mobiluncus curtisii]NMW46208.1 molybdopterin molybdotransferase MoeA [Mobiluncus curtisii]
MSNTEKLLDYQDFLASLLAEIVPLTPRELPVGNTLGLTLAEPVISRLSVPPFTNSAMDGFAFNSAGLPVDGSVTLSVAGDIPAGTDPGADCQPGQAWRIMTGAKMPTGADTVVKVEDTDQKPGPVPLPEQVTIHRVPRAGANVRRAGEDLPVGSEVLAAGEVMSPGAIASAISGGYAKVTAFPRVRVGIIATGSELAGAGASLEGSMIPDSNSSLAAALARVAQAEVSFAGLCGDDVAQFRETLRQVAETSDLVVTSGGVSAGAYEVVKQGVSEWGFHFARVALQPGKPQGYGFVEASGGRRVPVLTLPGNPVSVFVSWHLFVLPVLAKLGGRDPDQTHVCREATVVEEWTSPRGKVQVVPVRLTPGQPGETPTVQRTHRLGSKSHLVASLHKANALMLIDRDVESVAPWSIVKVIEI